jgi:catechol 2,3-dioxygenase-like lactoylglutathione lyase family enzyme
MLVQEEESHMERAISNLIQGYETGRLTRRDLIQNVALLAGMAGIAGSPALSAQPEMSSSLHAISVNHISITVGDVKRSKDWYGRLFNLKTLKDEKDVAFLGFGNTFLSLYPARGQARPGTISHFCFGLDNVRPEAVQAEFERLGVKAKMDSGGNSPSFLIQDPDGIPVQVGDKDLR